MSGAWQLFLAPHVADSRSSTGLLVLRVLAGSAMALHGAPKMLAATSWMGPGGEPGWLQFLAAFAEFAGGIAWLAGIATPLASVGIAVTMVVGILIAHVPMGDPLIRLSVAGAVEGQGVPFAGLPTWIVRAGGRSPGGSGSSELALLFTAISMVLILLGPGRFSLDALLSRRLSRS